MSAPPDDEAKPRRGRSVRQQLALFALALLAPVVIFSAVTVATYASSERRRIEADAGEIATSLATALDRELTGVFTALGVLSTSPYLENGDLEGFRRQALALDHGQGFVTLLSEPGGRQLVNTKVPDGQPFPITVPRWTPEQLEPGRPFVTDLIVGRATGVRQFLALMPVRRDGKLAYVLAFSMPLSRLQALLAQAEIPPSYTASFVDRRDVIMARSSRAEDFVGQTASPDLVEKTRGRSGSWEGTTADGVPVFGSYARSRLSDFRAAVGIRFSDLNAPLWRSLVWFAGLFALIAALSVLLAVLFGARIAGPISALARDAARLGRGEPVAAPRTGLDAADDVGAELARASSRLREREAELRDANEEIQRFAYIVSHDLRSPLVNIMGFTTELEALRTEIFGRLAALRVPDVSAADEDELGRDFDEAIGFIKTSIGKMDRLINAILALSREDRRVFAPARVDMDGLLATIKATLTVQAEAADATVTVGTLPTVFADRLAVEQVFTNLVDNALKYLRRGVPGRIEVRGEMRGRETVYTVADNGRGIDPKDRERVFDLFRRSGTQDRPGEGIGLAHVRAIVRRLGGTINLTSEPGQGSTFTVTLPQRPRREVQRKAA